MEDTNYKINIDVFEGPLDLLLYLIKKNDLSIYDIPIAFILEEYIKYIETMNELDIDLAGEFLLMASELAYIKSKMLLPDEGDAAEGEESDPRADLVERLLEYQRFKEASHRLSNLKQLHRDVFIPLTLEPVEESSEYAEADAYKLIEAFSKILNRVPKDAFHDVDVDTVSVSERVYQIIDILKGKNLIMLEELIGDDLSRTNVIVNFLALLEMSRLKMITLYQGEPSGPMHVRPSMTIVENEEEAKKLLDGTMTF